MTVYQPNSSSNSSNELLLILKKNLNLVNSQKSLLIYLKIAKERENLSLIDIDLSLYDEDNFISPKAILEIIEQLENKYENKDDVKLNCAYGYRDILLKNMDFIDNIQPPGFRQ